MKKFVSSKSSVFFRIDCSLDKTIKIQVKWASWYLNDWCDKKYNKKPKQKSYLEKLSEELSEQCTLSYILYNDYVKQLVLKSVTGLQ